MILCHGLGLNATFWTITDNHLPAQLTKRGYEVYVFDIRASGENARLGAGNGDGAGEVWVVAVQHVISRP